MAIFNPTDYQHLIGQHWTKDGHEYKLVGIMDGFDDWYWVMCRGGRFNKHTQLLSCVGDIEGFGYEPIIPALEMAIQVEECNEQPSDIVFKK